MKWLIPLALIIGTAASANESLQLRYGQGSCSTAYDLDTGRSVKFYGEVDSDTNEASIGFEYVIEFQKPRSTVDPCRDARRAAARSMELDIELKRLELELLRLRVERESQPRETDSEAGLTSDW